VRREKAGKIQDLKGKDMTDVGTDDMILSFPAIGLDRPFGLQNF
jgi:hypothetical protein